MKSTVGLLARTTTELADVAFYHNARTVQREELRKLRRQWLKDIEPAQKAAATAKEASKNAMHAQRHAEVILKSAKSSRQATRESTVEHKASRAVQSDACRQFSSALQRKRADHYGYVAKQALAGSERWIYSRQHAIGLVESVLNSDAASDYNRSFSDEALFSQPKDPGGKIGDPLRDEAFNFRYWREQIKKDEDFSRHREQKYIAFGSKPWKNAYVGVQSADAGIDIKDQ
mmetsp:Transcript_36750/g.59382  ORF Transcript_36750/g.59382 Transcript_36750/m.59382 type:complete len:231 (-) Transcript_36750:740-1432(-)